MPILEYNADSVLRRFDSNGLFAVEAHEAVEINRATLPAHAVFLVSDQVDTDDVWEGQRLPRRSWVSGDVAFMPARSELRSVADRRYRETVISLSDRLLVETTHAYIERSAAAIRYDKIDTPEIAGIVGTLHGLITSGEMLSWPLLTDSLALAMTAAVVRHFSPQEAERFEAKRAGLSAVRRRRTVDFVEANIGTRFDLSTMASAASLSPFHFSRMFKKTMGVSPVRYVLQRRVREAQALLRGSTKTLAEIALECGFASQSHFTTAFKKAVGVTPGRYRKGAASAALAWLAERVMMWAEPLASVEKMA